MSLTVHCMLKNEEIFAVYAIESVINYVEQVIVFDTGSTDQTVARIKTLAAKYPNKLVFEEKGPCTAQKHTELRQEMLNRTHTEWFMILDGDELWTEQGITEAVEVTKTTIANCILAPFYLCVGDIWHYSNRGKYKYDGMSVHALARLFRVGPDISWNLGPYGQSDFVKDKFGNLIRPGNYVMLQNKYWHTSALVRSSRDHEVGLGRHKQVITYSLKIIGEGWRIREPLPQVLEVAKFPRLPWVISVVNASLLVLYGMHILKKRIWL